MSKADKPPQWYNVYKGNDEAKFFRSLNRDKKYKWRSTSALANESGLSKTRVEEIVLKYLYDGKNPIGMVIQSPTNEDHWSYWENTPELLKKIPDSISVEDKNNRIDKAMGCQIVFNGFSLGTDSSSIDLKKSESPSLDYLQSLESW